MKMLKKMKPLAGTLLFAGFSLAARAEVVAETQNSIPMRMVDAGVCMFTECGVFAVLFIIVPVVGMWFYKKFINIT